MEKENFLISRGSPILRPKLKVNKKYLNELFLIISPYKKHIKKQWIHNYKSVFGEKASLSGFLADSLLEKWINLLFEVLETHNMDHHYKKIIQLGHSLAENNTPIEEVILSVHLLEGIIFPIMLKNFQDKQKLGKIIFSNDVLFHHELSCLAIAYFYKYKNRIEHLEKTREDLTHMIIHDLKNPISSIMIASSSLLKDFREKNKIDNIEYIEIINRLGNDLWNMTNNLLDINRIENKKFKIYPTKNRIGKILDETIEFHKPLIEHKNIKLLVHIEDIPEIYIDKDIIKRVIHNLLDNAIKYSPKSSGISINLKKNKNTIVFSISDMGPGINIKDRKRIFEKFAQAEFSKTGVVHGTGLGLAFCKMAMELLKGKIWIKSNQKVGSTFLFSLPVTDKPK
ncbi:MAG: HAMP domain-containing histidine kinase [Actinobacteria bacterium]|nr:HAMP domain-containing histidine kinase [Actinomycetota bacterium]